MAEEQEIYAARYWEIGDDTIDTIRKFIDEQVRNALIEYFERSGTLSLDYRNGGTPTITFSICTDNNVDGVEDIARYRRDLADVLLEEMQESEEVGPEEMHDLFKALFETYEHWRKNRIATDPRCNIPAPALVEDNGVSYAAERDELVKGEGGKWISAPVAGEP